MQYVCQNPERGIPRDDKADPGRFAQFIFDEASIDIVARRPLSSRIPRITQSWFPQLKYIVLSIFVAIVCVVASWHCYGWDMIYSL